MPFCDKETLQQLVAYLSDEQIAKQFGVSAVVVQRLRLRYRLLRKRIHSLDEFFFDVIDTPEKAYVLGFITADGHVSKLGSHVAVNVTETDRQLLEDICTAIKSDAPITVQYPGNGSYKNSKPMCRVNFCSQHLVSSLNALGLYHDKSVTATYPTLPEHLESHFVRGVFDGDGAITNTYFSITDALPLLEGIYGAFTRHTDCKITVYPHNRSPHIYVLRGNGLLARSAVHWMYTNPTIRLQRKYDKYLAYWYN